MPVKQGWETLGDKTKLERKVLKRVISRTCGAGK
jgi:hypothetical protein